MLAGWSSWGALPHIFDEQDQRLAAEREQLRELLSESEWTSARRTTLNAHYTDARVTSAIWGALGSAGFDGGRVLEPGSGAGAFIDTAPATAEMVGVELDETTARISATLYPQAQIQAQGFEETRLPENSLEAVVGNVPFGDFRVHDPRHNANRHSIHNHFILKSLRTTAPGGYVAVITSAHTLGAKTSKARDEMARYGDLVGAVRLPEGTFSQSAGTSVATDVLILRRRDPASGVDEARAAEWVPAGTIELDHEGQPHQLGWASYFEHHRENVIGEVRAGTDPYGNVVARTVRDGRSIEQIAGELSSRLETIVSEAGEQGLGYQPARPASVVLGDHAPGLHLGQEPEAGIGHVRITGTGASTRVERYSPDLTWEPVKHPKKDMDEARALLGMRDLARASLDAQGAGETEQAEQLRGELQTAWQDYYARFPKNPTGDHEAQGPRGINRRHDVYRTPRKDDQAKLVAEWAAQWRQDNAVEPDVELPADVAEEFATEAARARWAGTKQDHLKFLRSDPDRGLLLSIETYDPETGTAEPSRFQHQDVVAAAERPVRAAGVEDAVAICMDEQRQVELTRVAELLDIGEDQAREQIRGHVFTDPTTGVMTSAPQYLAGNVRQKLATAREAAAEDPETFGENVTALEKALPATIDLDDVRINPGARWVPEEYHLQFARELLESENVEVFHGGVSSQDHSVAGQDQWQVKMPQAGVADHIRHQFGVPKHRKSPTQILELAMNGRPVRFTTENDEGKRVVNEAATQAGREKVAKIRERFQQWVTADPARKQRLEARYNELFNSVVPADYSRAGAALQLPGLAEDRRPYSYQASAVARIVNEPATLLDHVVGSGKTGTMVMAAMELRRTGQAAKPGMVVPNHLVDQISAEFRQWYPNAAVLAIPQGISAEEKAAWVARASAGDWDCVVMPQTTFESIPLDPERSRAWLEADIEAAEAHARELAETKGSGSSHVKQAQKAVERLRTQYKEDASRKFAGTSFEQTGIDYLFIDEAHDYKNLARTAELAELSHTGSKRARDLDQKMRALRQFKTEDAQRRGVTTDGYVPSVATFATGTPVANSMSELWVMQRYLRPDLLEEMHLDTVDSWAGQFTEVETKMQLSVTGAGYEPKTRVSKYVNTPELAEMNRIFTDRVTPADLEVPIPEVAGGQRQLLTRGPSGAVADYTDELIDRVEAIRDGSVDPSDDNMLKLSSDARAVALDPRMVGLDSESDGGKIGAVADSITAVHESTKHRTYTLADGSASPRAGGLQIVFCDQGTPSGSSLDVYSALREELVARGMGAEQVAFIHDADGDSARAELFQQCRDGRVNVLIGSTQKMGTGANIQTRAVGLHHMDVPWRPADLEQREGRILRQGNQNSSVEIFAYGTERTFDVRSWDIVSHKAKFIGQWKSGMVTDRTMDDPIPALEFSASEAAAVLTGDPRIQQREELDLRIRELKMLEQSWQQNQSMLRGQKRQLTERIGFLDRELPNLEAMAQSAKPTGGDAFVFTRPDGATTTDRAAAGEHLANLVWAEATRRDQADLLTPTEPQDAGTLGGIDLAVHRHLNRVVIGTELPGVQTEVGVDAVLQHKVPARGLVSRAENLVSGLDERCHQWQAEREQAAETLSQLGEVSNGQWEHADELAELEEEFARLDAEINGTDTETEDQQAPISGETLARVYPNQELRSVGPAREGDVIKLDKDFYTVATVADDDDPTRSQVYLYDADEIARPADGELDEHPEVTRARRLGGAELISRRWEQLDGFDQTVAALDEDTERVESHRQLAKYPEGTRVSLRSRDTGGVVSARLGEAIAGSRAVYDEDGQPLERVRDYTPGRAVVNDIGEQIAADRQAVAEQDARAARERSPYHFLPGEVLDEDIENFGQAGDVVVSDAGNMRPRAMDPETASLRDPRGWPRPGDYQTLKPTHLTGEESKALYGAPTPGRVRIDELRCGDVVDASQIDTRGRSGTKAQIVQRTPTSFSDDDFIDITYRQLGVDAGPGEIEEGKKKAGSSAEVLSRTTGALTAGERARLYWPEEDQHRVSELTAGDQDRRVVVLPDDGIAVHATVGVMRTRGSGEELVGAVTNSGERFSAERGRASFVAETPQTRVVELYTEGRSQDPVLGPEDEQALRLQTGSESDAELALHQRPTAMNEVGPAVT